MNCFYWIAVKIFRLYANLFFDIDVRGINYIPVHRGCVLSSNHLSYFDPLLIASFVVVPVHFFAKDELFASPIKNFFMNKFNAIPVKRGSADRTAVNRALDLLASGEIVGVFPEGGISIGDDSKDYQTGVAMLAIHSGKPILSVKLTGSRDLYRPSLFRRKRVIIEYKRPLLVSGISDGAEDKKQLRKKIMDLIENQ